MQTFKDHPWQTQVSRNAQRMCLSMKVLFSLLPKCVNEFKAIPMAPHITEQYRPKQPHLSNPGFICDCWRQRDLMRCLNHLGAIILFMLSDLVSANFAGCLSGVEPTSSVCSQPPNTSSIRQPCSLQFNLLNSPVYFSFCCHSKNYETCHKTPYSQHWHLGPPLNTTAPAWRRKGSIFS